MAARVGIAVQLVVSLLASRAASAADPGRGWGVPEVDLLWAVGCAALFALVRQRW